MYYYLSTTLPVTGAPIYFTYRPTTHIISWWFDWAYIDKCVIIVLGLLVLSVCISFRNEQTHAKGEAKTEAAHRPAQAPKAYPEPEDLFDDF